MGTREEMLISRIRCLEGQLAVVEEALAEYVAFYGLTRKAQKAMTSRRHVDDSAA